MQNIDSYTIALIKFASTSIAVPNKDMRQTSDFSISVNITDALSIPQTQYCPAVSFRGHHYKKLLAPQREQKILVEEPTSSSNLVFYAQVINIQDSVYAPVDHDHCYAHFNKNKVLGFFANQTRFEESIVKKFEDKLLTCQTLDVLTPSEITSIKSPYRGLDKKNTFRQIALLFRL